MPAASLMQRVRHRPADIMTLVADVENYSRFIPLFSALRVRKRTAITDHHERFEAEAVIAYKFISETFRSVVDVHTDKCEIHVTKADKGGAVKSLDNDWVFYELSDGSTLVDFNVNVRLKAYPLELLARDKFPKVANKIMGLFINYAAQNCELVGGDTIDLEAEMSRLGLSGALTS